MIGPLGLFFDLRKVSFEMKNTGLLKSGLSFSALDLRCLEVWVFLVKKDN